LSRFSIIGGKNREQSEDLDDDESELGDVRTEGMNAQVFSCSIGANGYIPQHKEPPRYIKVRTRNKKDREFNRMFLAQELKGTKRSSASGKSSGSVSSEALERPSSSSKYDADAIWTTEFSVDGKYLAAAGQDGVIRVWSVISTPQERAGHEHEEDVSDDNAERLSAPVFRSKPIREFEGHTSVILDLSWSKNNFLLSSSQDKTVRLWHISRQECLCTFKHKDSVTSIAFHPKDDRFFLAGSLDSVLRLWSIPDKSVAFWCQLPNIITAVAFTPDGRTSMAGILTGLCLFYETEGLKYHTQIHVRSSRGKNAKGSKITGIRTATYPPNDPNGEVKVLISSNDSRVRLYNLRDKSLEMKFRGHENTCSQIRASFSDDLKYVICGSEDRKTYIWSTSPTEGDNKDKRPVEIFSAHSTSVTTSIMAPAKTRQLLGASGDPLYDLCNPPPVTLLSRAETNVSSREEEKRFSDGPADVFPTPAYLARSLHNDGNIIITADHSGSIKVFRQDCAYHKRRNDIWETGSTFSKKLYRHGSMRARRSGSSRRNSVNQTFSSNSTQLPQDHILNWANSIANNSNDGLNNIRTMQTTRSERSVSPENSNFSRRSMASSITRPTPLQKSNLASSARAKPYATTSNATPLSSPPASAKEPVMLRDMLPTPSFSLNPASDSNPLKIDTVGKSYQFWNVSNWKRGDAQTSTPTAMSPDAIESARLGVEDMGMGLSRGQSLGSRLSSDDSRLSEEIGSAEEADREGLSNADGSVKGCKRCGGREFRVKKGGGLGLGIGVGKAGGRLACVRCGALVE
jgi:WD40 repeat protein